MSNVTIPHLHELKRKGVKIVGIVAWDYQVARIADRAGVDIMSVGDSIGINLWGHANALEVTMDQMITVTQAVRRGTNRALLSCDFPYGPLQQGTSTALKAAIRFVKEAGVDMVKLDAAADYPDTLAALTRAGIPVWAQIGITPQTALQYGIDYAALSSSESQVTESMQARLVSEAKMLEEAGAALIDFTNSGPVVGPAVSEAVRIPVIGGLGGGPWLDGRVRMAHAAIGYSARHLDEDIDTYANVARTTLEAIEKFSSDVRAGKQIRAGTARKK